LDTVHLLDGRIIVIERNLLIMAHSVNLAWTASTDTVTGYNILRGTSATGPFTLVNSTPLASTATTYTDVGPFTGLGPFYYTAQSITATETSVDSNVTAAVFLPPAAPTNLTVTSSS
jgi:hypothetical protein